MWEIGAVGLLILVALVGLEVERRSRIVVVPGRFQQAVASLTTSGEDEVVDRTAASRHDTPRTVAESPTRRGERPNRTWSDDFVGDGVTAAAIGGASVADWWHVDETVLDALGHLSGREIDSVIDLWRLVGDQSYHLTDGWFEAIQGHVGEGLFISLRGHVGEQIAAQDLTQAGASVVWPEAANQQGWDLEVNGQLVNVKVTADAGATAADHFSINPEIPVIVNADAANVPEGAIHFDPSTGIDPSILTGDNLVLVDEALSAHASMEVVQDAFGADAIHGALTDVELPVLTLVITAVRSGSREERLRRDGKTTGKRAAKNVALDTGVRTAGVVAGAKAGAAAGALVDASAVGTTLGLATVVGAILGALGGGMGGSAFARRVRLRPLRHAQEKARDALSEYDTATAAASAAAQEVYRRAQANARFALALRALIARRELEALIGAERAELRERRRVDASAIIGETLRECSETVTRFPEAIRGVAPSRWRLALQRRALRLWEEDMWRTAQHANDGPYALERFWDTVAATPAGQRRMHEWIKDVEEQRIAGYARCGIAASNATTMLGSYQASARRRVLSVAMGELVQRRRALEPIAGRVRTTHDAFIAELVAAGIKQSDATGKKHRSGASS